MNLVKGFVRLKQRVYVSVFAIISFFLFAVSERSVYPLFVMLSALVHECGHLWVMRVFGVEISRVWVFPYGVQIDADLSKISYKKEMLVMLSGAGANFVLSAACGVWFAVLGGEAALFLCLSNVLLGAFNCLPVSGLDGGKALFCFLCQKGTLDRAINLGKMVSVLSYAVVCMLFVSLLWVTGFNTSLVIMLLYAALVLCASAVG